MKIQTMFSEWPDRVDWAAADMDSDTDEIGIGNTEAEAIADLLSQIGWGDQGLPQ